MAENYNVPDNFSAFHHTHGIAISTGPEGLTVQKTELLFPAQGELRFVGIVSDAAYEATVAEGDEWLSFQPVSEGLNVIVAANGTGADREGKITVSLVNAGEEAEPVEITVKQSQHSALNFTVSPSVVSVDAAAKTEGTAVSIDILTQKAYTVFSGASWCRLTPTFGNTTEVAKLEIDENTAKEARAAQLEFRCGAKKLKMDVHQAGAAS